MSRLYEALKGANRNRRDVNGREALYTALDLNGIEVAAEALETEAPEIAAPKENVAAPPTPFKGHLSTESAAAAEIELPAVENERHQFGIKTHAGLDRTARLLPHSASPMLADYYRRLRTKILQQREQSPFRSVVVTSAAPQEGKTVTVLNLALSFCSLPNFKVLVVDADFRKGTLGSWIGVDDGQPGLSNLLCGTSQLEDVVLKSDDIPMDFMVSGTEEILDLHPSHFGAHFKKLGEMYDLVLIDSPPVNLIADVQLLAANADAVLLVARAFSTTRKALEKAAQELSPFRIIGAVLNAGVAQRAYRYYGHY